MKFLLFLSLAALTATAQNTQNNCTTPAGSTVPDGQVAATANFTVSAGSVTVTLANNLVDPRSAGQLLSGLAFTLSTGQTSATLGANSANIRSIGSAGNFTDLGPQGTGWALNSNFNGGLFLCVLCNDLGSLGPSHLLIGDPNPVTNVYTGVNGSIANNKPHNPFTAGTATFLINVPALTGTETITGATFYFSTQAGVSVTGTCSGGGGVNPGD